MVGMSEVVIDGKDGGYMSAFTVPRSEGEMMVESLSQVVPPKSG